VTGDVRDRVAEIQHNYEHDLAAFALYARTDARLAYQIVEKLNLVPLAFARSALTGMTPDRVRRASRRSIFCISPSSSAAHRRATCAPATRACSPRSKAARARIGDGLARQRLGVRLQEPVPEHHPHVQHRSLGYVPDPKPGEDLVRTAAAPSAASPRSCPACSTSCSRAAKQRRRAATTSRRKPSRS